MIAWLDCAYVAQLSGSEPGADRRQPGVLRGVLAGTVGPGPSTLATWQDI